jgi:hypothetical protein
MHEPQRYYFRLANPRAPLFSHNLASLRVEIGALLTVLYFVLASRGLTFRREGKVLVCKVEQTPYKLSRPLTPTKLYTVNIRKVTSNFMELRDLADYRILWKTCGRDRQDANRS